MARVCLGNIKGPKGDPGPAGPKGDTPVKGVDYFTEEDLKSINGSTIESTEHPGCYYRTVNGETEWINPPMLPDVEYRTAERFSRKPVYIMYISNFGSLPDNTAKQVAMPIDNTHKVIDIDGYALSGPAFRNLSAIDCEVYVTAEWTLTINTKWYASAYTAHIFIKYIKD